MAKRGRVPARKRLGPTCRQRNHTPKLSPFQKEMRRDRLANQPPTTNVENASPKSTELFNYLKAKEDKVRERKERKLREAKGLLPCEASESKPQDDATEDIPQEVPRLVKLATHTVKKRARQKIKRDTLVERSPNEDDWGECECVNRLEKDEKPMTAPATASARVAPLQLDFDDLMDVVAFTDRVDAPPSLPALRNTVRVSVDVNKRSQAIQPSSATSKGKATTSEFEATRQRVMDAYKRYRAQERKNEREKVKQKQGSR